jgi:glycosyltransferase involved in cell wall biosynthesis
MKIVLDVSSLAQGPGGIPTVTRGLAESLAKRDDVTLELVTRKPLTLSDERGLAGRLSLVRPTLPRILWMAGPVPAYLRRTKADAFVSPAFATPLFTKCTTVTYLMDGTPFNEWRPSGGKGISLLLATRISAQRASLCLFPARSVSEEYVAQSWMGKGRGSTRVVPLAVQSSASGASGHVPGNRLLWAGSSVTRKDRQTFDEALNASGYSRPVALLDPGREGVDCNMATVESLFYGAEALVVTSRYEGFSLPIAEARSLGVPVVCSDIPVHREVADHASTIFFKPGNVAELAEILRERRWLDCQPRISWTRTWDDVISDILSAVSVA